ncbi:hypothetical protein DWU99_02295 [Dyella psychrodurans]|uniref:Uncharacterized protein n=1 Tax=Dyella psychrodurans TaxID=1927960 RepID=A0A370XCX5_9GAMM|nr:hypothetical protein DWU99_02295 [Dyella psychrodurans]
MSECVTLNSNGTLTDQGPATSSSTGLNCAGYVLVDGESYGMFQAVNSAFAAPQPSDAVSWFVGCWGTVMFFYLVAYLCGTVVNFFNKK